MSGKASTKKGAAELEKALGRGVAELAPAQLVYQARACAERLLEDPGFFALVHLLEVDIFQQWQSAGEAELDQARAQQQGLARLLVKLRELTTE